MKKEGLDTAAGERLLGVIKDTETDDFCRVPSSSCTYVFQIRCVFLLGDMMCTNINIHICIYIYICISS